MPKHVFDDGQELRTNPKNMAPVGSGPFRFVEFTPGQQIVLDRYQAFFIPDQPVLDRVIYSMINDQTSAVLTLERGDADLLANLNSPRDAVRLSKNPDLVVSDKGYEAKGGLTWLAFNMLKEPLNDKRVRQAICYAADRETILKNILQGKARAATGPIHPSSPFYTDAVEHYAVDFDKANKLLDEAGHPRGADGTRFKLVLDYSPAIGEVIKSTAEYLRQQLRKVGIDIEVRTSPDSATWARRIGDWDFDMTIDSVLNWGDPSIGVARTYASSNIRKGVVWTNTQNYSNPKVDQLLDQAAGELDVEKRKALYTEFQKIVVDDAPIYFINVTFFVTSYKKTLAGISESIWGVTADPMDQMYWIA
jgi:peptide/nickel transport system substrate-binding protein